MLELVLRVFREAAEAARAAGVAMDPASLAAAESALTAFAGAPRRPWREVLGGSWPEAARCELLVLATARAAARQSALAREVAAKVRRRETDGSAAAHPELAEVFWALVDAMVELGPRGYA